MQHKKQYKKTKRENVVTPGYLIGVTVFNSNIEMALKIWKRKLKDSGMMEELRDRKEYMKPTTKRREQRKNALRAEYRRRLYNDM
jgi:small subunit ribosomal protein S21